MKQCKKILDKGQRCSNPVVPGTDYCKKHKRQFTFKKISQQADTETMPERIPAAEANKDLAFPSKPGEKILFPKLAPDKREILVAPSACIDIQSKESQSINQNLCRSIVLLSSMMPLSPFVQVKGHKSEQEILVFIQPEQKYREHLSVFYDSLADIAHNCDARLYIGDENLFIQYRDEYAPRGYDAQPPSSPEKGYSLIDGSKNRVLKHNAFTDQSIESTLLTIRPQKSGRSMLAQTAFLMSPIPLYALISKYLSARKLMFSVARCVFQNNQQRMIYQISLREQTGDSTHIPQFLLHALSDLPDCHVFLQPFDTQSKKILIAYGCEHPCKLKHIADCFSDNQMVLFFGDASQENLCISPEPVFIEGDALIKGQMNYSHPIVSKSDNKTPLQQLSIHLKLIHDSRSGHLVSALILTHEEYQWLMKTLYVLPENLIQSMTIFWGESHVIIQAKELNLPIFPFGIPMQKIFDTHLFIPMHSRLVPSLSWESIKTALNLSSDYATFLTPDFRMDCALSSWAPLSRNVMSHFSHQNISIDVKQKRMPALKWTVPLEQTSKKSKKLFQRKRNDSKKEEQDTTVSSPDMRGLAENSLSQNKPFKAGLYYFLADEKLKAAQCIEKVLTI